MRVLGKAKEYGSVVVYDTDDLLTDLYDGHRLQQTYIDLKLSEITKALYQNADVVCVTQSKFAERIKPYCNGILAVVQNAIDYSAPCWNAKRTFPKKPLRVGYAAGIHHLNDVQEFAGVPHMVNQKFGREKVIWDMYGHPPPGQPEKEQWQIDTWKKYRDTFMRGFKGHKNWNIHYALPPAEYGSIFANMDIGIAPLQMNSFNDSKSSVKIAECGRYKVPLICSDVGCYNETIVNWETGVLIPPDAGKTVWVKALTRLLKDDKLRKEMGENLHSITEQYFDINKVVDFRLELYQEAMKMFASKNKADAKV